MTRYPDFFIVGAPRSGTTFMFDYLGMHPRIHVPGRKEPQFFATDLDSGSYLDSLSFMRDRDEYLRLFAGAREDQLTGEASTWYLYSTAAAQNIKAAAPDARIIAMLRHPVEMLYSLHGRRLYAGSEDLPDFADALAAEDDRRAGRRIPARARNVKALLYRDVGRYGEQLQRYMDTFGQDRVRVVVFEEFVKDPAAAYRGVLQSLGIDADFQPDFRIVNAGAARRSPRLQKVLLAPPVVKVARFVIPPRLRPAVGRAWDRLTTRRERRPPLDPQVAAALRADLLPDIEHLGRLLGRDMTEVWR
jgi:hypothetical protein